MAGSKIFHDRLRAAARDGDQIATKGDIFGSQRHTHAGGFQGRAAGVIDRRVVTHDAHVADIAAWGKTFRNDMGDAVDAMLRQPVHVGRACRFQGRLVAQRFDRIVGHAVALKNDIFHLCKTTLSFLTADA